MVDMTNDDQCLFVSSYVKNIQTFLSPTFPSTYKIMKMRFSIILSIRDATAGSRK